MLYWTNWPDNTGVVAIQLNKDDYQCIGRLTCGYLLDWSLELCMLLDAIFLQEYDSRSRQYYV